jgi:hypothetical protein
LQRVISIMKHPLHSVNSCGTPCELRIHHKMEHNRRLAKDPTVVVLSMLSRSVQVFSIISIMLKCSYSNFFVQKDASPQDTHI